MPDVFDQIIAAPDPCAAPALIDLIAAETDRTGMIRFRAVLIRRAKAHAAAPPRIWLSLLDRRIADLYRGGAHADQMNLHQLADALQNGWSNRIAANCSG